MRSIECETKLELDAESFEELLASGELQSHRSLLNIYYDAGTQLSEVAATFRIRLSSNRNRPVVQLKLPPRIDGDEDFRTQRELEWEVSPTAWRSRPKQILVESDLPAEFADHLAQFGIDRLQRIGWLRTDRWEVRLPNGPQIELDRITLPDGATVFEAEIESQDPGVHYSAMQKIRALIGSTERSTQSKYERFSEALRSVQPETAARAR